jgi:peptidylprolyl isomerase
VRRIAAILLVPALLLVGCGGDSGDSSNSETTSTAGGSTAAAPTVSGEFGKKPTVTPPSSDPSKTLVQTVLKEGDGEVVKKGDLLVAHYLGETWAEKKVFDNSYDRGQPAGFGIGIGAVIPGWDKALVGKKVGDRVLLSIPPADGYGDQGNADAGIKGTDTLVFVVDIVNTFHNDLAATGTPATVPAGLPKVTGAPGSKPTVTIAKGTKAPTKAASAVVIKGDGAAIDPTKTLVTQVVQADYATGKTVYESWSQSPQAIPAQALPGLFDAMKGQKIGSRVLLVLPSNGQQGAAALAIDVVGTF